MLLAGEMLHVEDALVTIEFEKVIEEGDAQRLALARLASR